MAARTGIGKHELRLRAVENADEGLSRRRVLLPYVFMRNLLLWALALAALPASAVEQTFNFGETPPDQAPPGFRSIVGGGGKPGDWRVILEEVPSEMAPLTPQAPSITRHAVLAQLAREPVNDHFPMFIYDRDTYADFTLTTRFKIAGGGVAQMAGVVFRFKDERNYYALFASALDGRFWFYKMVDGVRGPLIGPEVAVQKGDWHSLTVQCEGNHIHCLLDGKELIPMLTDNSFVSGKVGFWSKSDSICYFSDARVTFTRQDSLADRLVKEGMKAYPRLLGLKIYAIRQDGGSPVVVASSDPKELGVAGGKTERDVIARGAAYVGKSNGTGIVTVPLHDRNGDPIAAVCVTLKSFPGQTEDNLAVRAQPVVHGMQVQVESLDDLLK